MEKPARLKLFASRAFQRASFDDNVRVGNVRVGDRTWGIPGNVNRGPENRVVLTQVSIVHPQKRVPNVNLKAVSDPNGAAALRFDKQRIKDALDEMTIGVLVLTLQPHSERIRPQI